MPQVRNSHGFVVVFFCGFCLAYLALHVDVTERGQLLWIAEQFCPTQQWRGQSEDVWRHQEFGTWRTRDLVFCRPQAESLLRGFCTGFFGAQANEVSSCKIGRIPLRWYYWISFQWTCISHSSSLFSSMLWASGALGFVDTIYYCITIGHDLSCQPAVCMHVASTAFLCPEFSLACWTCANWPTCFVTVSLVDAHSFRAT